MLTKVERVRSLLGNLKNWDWTVHPQFRVEKEDAEALMDYLKDDKAFSGVRLNER